MELQEMPAVVRYQNAPPVSISCSQRGQHIVAKAAQLRHNLQRDVLVGIKQGH
jgi:hypothetical protein